MKGSKDEKAPAIERGQVFEGQDQARRRLVVIEPEENAAGKLKLQDEESTAMHFVSLKTLAKKYMYIGRHITVDGELKFVPESRIGSAPTVDAQRTEEPADPPMDAAGAAGAEPENDDRCDHEERENEFIPAPASPDDYEYILALVLAGKVRAITIEFKNKEGRAICSCGGAQLHAGGTFKDFLEHVCAFIHLHWTHVSPMPKPGELPFRSTAVSAYAAARDSIAADASVPKADDVPTTPPAAPGANGEEAQPV